MTAKRNRMKGAPGIVSAFLLAVIGLGLWLPSVFPQAQQGAFIKDEVYFSVARRINERTESPVSAIVAALGDVIEVVTVTPGPEGKVTAVVKEVTASNARATNKSIRLTFIPSGVKDKWKWESFEDNRKLYETEKLFPYAKERLDKARQLTEQRWEGLLKAINTEGEAAAKVLETAKAILKSEPAAMPLIMKLKVAFAEAVKGPDTAGLGTAHRELEAAMEPILTLADDNPDLKANDAYLRLLEEMKAAQNAAKAARKGYLDSVDVYNDDICRLPFALVAYGLEYTKLEPKLPQE
ncbi:MAG: LemA family protein [Acidobacteriota bacterium]